MPADEPQKDRFEVTAAGHRLMAERLLPAGRKGAAPAASEKSQRPTLVFLHEGLGSIAQWKDVPAKLAAKTGLPALVVALDPESGVGKGSGRSVRGLDLGAAVIAARQAGLLINGGGHAMAAGLTVASDQLAPLRAFLSERVAAALEAAGYRPALGFDGAIQTGGADAGLVREIERCAPFGAGNAQPRFALAAARVLRADVVGDGHVRCALGGTDGGRLKGIAFRALDGALGPALLNTAGRPLHLAGKLRLDAWAGGDAVQFIIEDAAPASG